MNNKILDRESLTPLALAFEGQTGLFTGLYDREGKELFLSENTSFLESEIKDSLAIFQSSRIENVIDQPVYAVAIRNGAGDFEGMWLLRPNGSKSREEMNRALVLLETFMDSYIREREDALSYSSRVMEFEKTGEGLARSLKQNEVVTKILETADQEDNFEKVIQDILTLSGEFLEVSNTFILQVDGDDKKSELVASWSGPGAKGDLSGFDGVPLSDIPFVDGLSYTISSDSRMPDNFKNFLQDQNVSAGIFLPIFLNEVNVMYLCATMEGVNRRWLLSEAGFLNDIKGVIVTVLAKRITRNSLANSFAQIESVLENTWAGICVIERERGSVLYTNKRFRELFYNPYDRDFFEKRIKHAPETMTLIQEYYLENAKRYVSINLSNLQWEETLPVLLCTITDITETKDYQIEVEKRANVDELTGIFNRKYFEKELSGILKSSNIPGALISMNIDGFKDVNLSFGSAAGDNLLSSVAKYLLKISGENVRVYRLGADEFGIIIKDTRKTDPRDIAESIVKRFDAPWQLTYTDCYLTVSVGVCAFPKDGGDLLSVVKCSSIALSEARRKAGCIEYYNESMEVAQSNRISQKALIRDCVKDGCKAFEPYKLPYRFIFPGDKTRGGFISMMKWEIPEMGVFEYHDILKCARSQQVDYSVLEYFIQESVALLREQNDFGYPEYIMGIPVFAEDLVRHDIDYILGDAIEKYAPDTDNILICLVGAWPDRTGDLAKQVCKSIRNRGIHIAFLNPGDRNYFGEFVDVQAVIAG